MVLAKDACPCGSRLPVLRVEGRTDEILYLLPTHGTRRIPIIPQALDDIIEGTPGTPEEMNISWSHTPLSGVAMCQVIQRGESTLHIRLRVKEGADGGEVWDSLAGRIGKLLAVQGLPNVEVTSPSSMHTHCPLSAGTGYNAAPDGRRRKVPPHMARITVRSVCRFFLSWVHPLTSNPIPKKFS